MIPAMTRMTRRRRLAFALGTWAALLLALEIGTRAVQWVRGDHLVVTDESLEQEWRWAENHLAAGKAELASDLVFDPQTGSRTRPGIRSEKVNTNSAGMRGAAEFPLERAPGRRRALLVGDSYTFGQFVGDAETYGHYLASGPDAPLAGWEVLNLGVVGTGTDQQVLQFEAHGRAWKPDVVVLGFFVRDYSRNTIYFRDYAKPVFVPDDGPAGAPDGLRLTRSPVIAPQDLFEEYRSGRRVLNPWHRSHALGALGGALRRLRDRSVTQHSPGWIVLSRLMARFQRVVRESGATPVWLVIPSQDEKGARWRTIGGMSERRARELGLACVNAYPAFDAWVERGGAPLYNRRDAGGHLSPAGHALVARELGRAVGELPPR